MAPGSGKRKRTERQYSHDDGGGRPSPHRPENLHMAQRGEREGAKTGRGGQRQSRPGGPVEVSNTIDVMSRNATASPATQQQFALHQAGMQATDSSRSGTPVARIATPTNEAALEKPKGPSVPFAYDYVTDEAVSSWQENGKQSVAAAATTADETVMSLILQELVRSSLDGRISPTEGGQEVRRAIAAKQQSDIDVQSLFLDTISLLDEADTTNPALLAMLAATDIDPEVIRKELDVPILQTLSLVRNTFERMRARKTTNSLYRQANFNLLREESEGYAKLLTEYFNIVDACSGNQEVSSAIAEDAFQRVKALVGAFDLDVGRVLDITMDISANAVVRACVFIVKFYRCSSWWRDDSVLENVAYEEPEVSRLPLWAFPGSTRSTPNEEERQRLENLRTSRDERFWTRVQEIGMTALFELDQRRVIDLEAYSEVLNAELEPTYDNKKQEVNADKRRRINNIKKYVRDTKLLPPPGNADAAQLLGLKLQFYASSARNANDIIPENLIHFTALLIKVGFISLRDLYPHLYPPDDQMVEERKRLELEKAEKDAKERPGAGTNALAMAGVLTDDTLPVTRPLKSDKDRSGGATPKPEKKEDNAVEELPRPDNQKLYLLKALLAHGAIPESLFILGRFPWLVDVDTELPSYLNRILRHMLSKVSNLVRPLFGRSDLGQAKEQIADTSPRLDGTLMSCAALPKRTPMKWLKLEKVSEDGQQGQYYYTDWSDSIPVCRNVEDVLLLCNTFLGYLGPKIGQDPTNYGTLLRLARRSLEDDTSEKNRSRWLEVMKRLLVPASSFTKHNPSLADELYQLLMLYPVTVRYSIYAEWFTGRTSRQPDVKSAFEYNRAEVKEVMRRISNDNVKTQSKALGKVSYSSPGVLIMYMINQLESYTNMIPALVKCTEYFPKLAYDVMTWCLINALSGTGRDRVQADGMLTSPWLQALSQFVAALFQRYSEVNPSPILQYLASELRKGESTDLEMLEQILTEMAGVRSDMEFNDQQVLAMSGGEILQGLVVQQLGDTRHARKNSAKRLIKALADPGLIGQLLISIAQQRQMYAHHESTKFMPLKVLGNNLDKIQRVFAQYLEVLKYNLKAEDFEAAVPDVTALIGEYGIPPGIAFTICRTAIAYRMHEYDDTKRQEEQDRKKGRSSQEKAHSNGEVDIHESDLKHLGKSEQSTDAEPISDNAPVNGEGNDSPAPVTGVSLEGGTHSDDSPWHPVLKPIISRLREVTGSLHERVSIPFFVTFWTLTQSDVIVLMDCYTHEINVRQKAQLDQINRDRSTSSSAVQQRQREKKAIEDMQEKLRLEAKSRIGIYTRISNRLSKREKWHWFDRSRDRERLDARHAALLQECFLPRAILSSVDAHYSFLMLRILHEKAAPGFSTLHLMTQLFRKQELAAIIYQCTANEARNLGRFLNEIIKLLGSWHAKKDVYEHEALGKRKVPGFAIGPLDYDDMSSWTLMEYETYRRQLFNWHTYLSGALQLCFESGKPSKQGEKSSEEKPDEYKPGEYNHIRNGIIVLNAIVQNFPQLNFHGKTLMGLVEKISIKDPRQDLKIMAVSLYGMLKLREKSWILPQAFRLNELSKDDKSVSRQPSARLETPPPCENLSQLNAAAPEFKPTSTRTNGIRKESATVVEDGEVEDDKPNVVKGSDVDMTDAPNANSAAEQGASPKEPYPTKVSRRNRTPEPSALTAASAESPNDRQHSSTPYLSESNALASVNGRTRHESNRTVSGQLASSRGSYGPPRVEPRLPAQDLGPALYSSGHRSRDDEFASRPRRFGDSQPSSRNQSPGGRNRARTPPLGQIAREERPRAARDDSYVIARRDAPQSSMHSRSLDSREKFNGFMGPPATYPSDRGGAFLPSTVSPAPQPMPRSRPPSSGAQTAQSSTHEPQATVNPDPQRIIDQQNARNAHHVDRERRVERDLRGGLRSDMSLNANGSLGGTRELSSPRDSSEYLPSGPRSTRSRNDYGREHSRYHESSYGRLDPPPNEFSVSKTSDLSGTRPDVEFAGQAPGSHSKGPDSSVVPVAPSRPSYPSSATRPHQPRTASSERNISGPQFDGQPKSSAAQSATTSELPTTVHPSRLHNLQLASQPAQVETNVQVVSGSRNASSPTSAPPSGPRGAGNRAPFAPSAPSPLNSAPPSGPAAIDRRSRERQRANINAQMAQTANGPSTGPRNQDVSFRGASNRQNSSQVVSSAAMDAPVQAIASSMEPPQPRAAGMGRRQDDMGHTSSQVDSRGEDFQRSVLEVGDFRRREDQRIHFSHRGSRNPSRERRRDDGPMQSLPPSASTDNGRDQRVDERRYPREERARPEASPRELRGSERGGREDGRRLPHIPSSSFSGPPPSTGWHRDDARIPRRGGARMNVASVDYRGIRRDEDRRDGGSGMMRDDPPPIYGRKRGHEGPPDEEDWSKRRRSGK